MKLRRHTGMDTKLFDRALKVIKACDVVVDVGCGIRPQNMIPCKRHICVEPHGEYADILEKFGYEVVRKKANEALDSIEEADTIVALDVIEHMEKSEGIEFIGKAVSKARNQVIIFTPLGFMPQEETGATDSWGLHGQELQRHRSGWTPDEFSEWKCFVEKEFHHKKEGIYGAFFAVHTA